MTSLAVILGVAMWSTVGLLTMRRRPVGTFAALIGVAWGATALLPGTIMVHRAVLVHLLLAGDRWLPRTWPARIVVVATYAATAVTWPWTWPAIAALAGLLVVVAAHERNARPVSVLRRPAWRWATFLTSAAFVLPPVLSGVGLGPDWARAVLVGYALAHLVMAVLVVLAASPWVQPWGTDIAVDLRESPRVLLEHALATTAEDEAAVRQAAAEADAAAGRLAERLRTHQAELTHTLTESEVSRRRLESVEEQERRALRTELDAVTMLRLRDVIRELETLAPGACSSDPQLREVIDRARDHVQGAVADLDALGAGLAPSPLRHGIVAALSDLAATCPLPVTLDLPDDADDTLQQHDLAECLYYVASEALTNVTKHSQASAVLMRLHTSPSIELLIADDGVGATARMCGAGLENIRERALDVGGHLMVAARRGHGTNVILSIPEPP